MQNGITRSQNMDEIISRFLEAHVTHELNRFKRGGYKKTIKEEVAAVFEWIKKIKLKDVITPEQIIGLIRAKCGGTSRGRRDHRTGRRNESAGACFPSK